VQPASGAELNQLAAFSLESTESPSPNLSPNSLKIGDTRILFQFTPFLFILSVAIVARAFRSHQRDRKEAGLRPGVAACFMVVASTILYMIVNPVRKLFYGTLYYLRRTL
jgi:hypothetical protein